MAEALMNIQYDMSYPEKPTYSFGDTDIDVMNRKAVYKGKEVELTHMEMELLLALIAYENTILSRERLLNMTWGYSFAGYTRTVDVHIWKLRNKLHLENYIRTVYKAGYMLETA